MRPEYRLETFGTPVVPKVINMISIPPIDGYKMMKYYLQLILENKFLEFQIIQIRRSGW